MRRLVRRVLTVLWRGDPSRSLEELPVELIEHTLDHFRQGRDRYDVRHMLLDEQLRFGRLLDRGRQLPDPPHLSGMLVPLAGLLVPIGIAVLVFDDVWWPGVALIVAGVLLTKALRQSE
ncbi:hypothetical protein ACFC0D_08265 [Streptomyces sp. NPDC056222]|uniref:hypothetical protein n=1 Tax=Streptomyces sp. NPDC056222 TaxID=3345749 RepID=UPI0035DBE184